MENNTSKYFKYAIGEILLVVVGILIAVEINSCVNSRQVKRDNEVFLKKMVSELELNKERLNFLMSGTMVNGRYINLEDAIRNDTIALKMTYEGLKSSDLDFFINNPLSSGGSYLNLHKGTYEELLNTGKLYTLGSDELITEIKNYYKRCQREDLYNKDNSDNMNEGFKKIEMNLEKIMLDFQVDPSNFSFDNYPWYFDQKSEQYQNLQMGIALISGGQMNNYFKMGQLIKYSDTLISVIDKELKSNYD